MERPSRAQAQVVFLTLIHPVSFTICTPTASRLWQDTYPSNLFRMEESSPNLIFFSFTLGKQHHLPSYASQNLAVSFHFTTTPFFLCPLTSNILSQFTVTMHPDYSTSFLTLQSLLPSSPSSTLQNTVSSQLFIRHLLLKSLRGFPL